MSSKPSPKSEPSPKTTLPTPQETTPTPEEPAPTPKKTPAPKYDPEDVLFHTLYGLRSMELHRPAKLNALDLSMIKKIEARLLEWSKSDMANVIVIKGAGDRAFCAGGDVAALAEFNKAGKTGKSIEYFRREYQLDHLIATYNKPIVAFMDGITMGGGVGLSVHAPFRIATERTLFAMPETTIGFFPDVGASYFLPRLPGAVGTYLALTSERLSGANVFYAGIASHYLHSTSLPALESRLAELRFDDYVPLETRLATINSTIDEFSTGLPHDQPIRLGGPLRAAIDRTFSPPTIPDIISALEAESAQDNPHGPDTAAWAKKTLKTLRQRSPISLHVTRKQMQLGARWSLGTAFRREHQLAARFMTRSDFNEGVDALLISKPTRKPVWDPPSLDDALPADRSVEWYFTVDEDLRPLKLHEMEGAREERRGLWEGGKEEKPRSALFALPREEEVEELVAREALTPKKVVERMLVGNDMKQGVREVVGEILARRTRVDEQGYVKWVYKN